jgi:hypothetical protein
MLHLLLRQQSESRAYHHLEYGPATHQQRVRVQLLLLTHKEQAESRMPPKKIKRQISDIILLDVSVQAPYPQLLDVLHPPLTR